MREPSGRGTRGLLSRILGGRGCLLALFFALSSSFWGATPAFAQTSTPIARAQRFTGNINFVTTGGSLRSQSNATNACSLKNPQTSVQDLNGIPPNTTIQAVYLYWGHSGTTTDTSVTLNGTTVTAARTFTAAFANPTLNFRAAYADITNQNIVTGNGTYTFGNLTVQTGEPWCSNEAVLGGWALIVVYQGANERLRAINIFDGLEVFLNSSITLNPNGFRVPATNIDGRIAVVTYEGDPSIGGTTASGDSLRFNGALIDDNVIPAGSNPQTQQFDGTVNTALVPMNAQSYGVDVDQYVVNTLIAAGQTSATTVYTAENDRVLLNVQIVSVTTEPVVDLSVTASHTGNFTVGTNASYSITVRNEQGVEREDNIVTVTDVLPAGLSYVSATGTGWTCGAVGQTVTCTHPPFLNSNAAYPPITLTVAVSGPAYPSIGNTVTVSSTSIDIDTSNNSDTDTATVVGPNLSTSTKTVVDRNGGEVAPGDTLRYTITLIESANQPAPNVSVTDDIPANTSFASFVSIPAGATSVISPIPNGANARGAITVSGINMTAGSTTTVVFDVTVIAGTNPNATIDNSADVDNPNGTGATPNAPQLVVTPSLVPATGAKFLYLRRDGSGNRTLQRVRPSTADSSQAYNNGQTFTWPLIQPLAKSLTLSAGSIPVRLWLSRDTSGTNRTVEARLVSGAWSTPWVTDTTGALSTNAANPTLRTLALNNAAAVTLNAGATLTLEVRNSTGTNNRTFTVYPNGNGGSTGGVPNNSRVELNSTTLISVDSVQTFNAAYSGGTLTGSFYPGNTVFIRAQVSDPFGSFDISAATLTITNPAGAAIAPVPTLTAQGAPATCGSATQPGCIYEAQYVVPNAAASLGNWVVRVTANEGVEGTVSDFGVGSFSVVYPQPSLMVLKSSQVLSDPTGSANPKRIPNAVVLYQITVTNSGPGAVDAGTLVISDPVPANSSMYVGTTPGDPVVFTNGTPASGLSFTYATHVSYSSVGPGGPWLYIPVPDANGFDAAVRAVRIAPGGTMSAAGSGNPSFNIQFRVRIN